MPHSAPTPCKSPGCPKLVKEGTAARGYCVGHVRGGPAPRRTTARRGRMTDEEFKEMLGTAVKAGLNFVGLSLLGILCVGFALIMVSFDLLMSWTTSLREVMTTRRG